MYAHDSVFCSSILGPRPPEKEDDKAELEMQPNKISTENQPNTAKPHSPENEGG